MIPPINFSLKNGLRVIVIPQKESPSVTAAVLVQAGAAYEKQSNNGISHFLEHMCFKGTSRRPTALKISTELETLGASYNAFTSRDFTGYYAKVAFRHSQEITDIISDMYLNPLLDPIEIEKEKGVIIEEINMYEDEPRAKVSEILEKLMYGNQPAGWNVAGPKENIRKITRADFVNYRNANYVSPKTILVLAGNITISKACVLAEKYFEGVHRSKIIISSAVKETGQGPKIMAHYKDLDQTHFVLAFKAFSIFDKKKYALSVLADVLGGGMSSRLFQKLREDLGAAYYVGASANLYATHGYMDVFAGVNHGKASEAIKATVGELSKIAERGITDEELSRVKEHKIGTFLLSLETSSDLAFYYGEQIASGESPLTPEQTIKKFKSVTKEEVARLARQILQKNKLYFAVVGPYKKTDPFRKLLSL
jgi:predicted Zn-dependent peptidase